MKLGLMFFAASEDATAADKYRLVIDSARFADANGFVSVWVPERHFTKFGSLYPNPAVLHAALAMVTERIALRAGSVVGPLHHPFRIAEEWSVVDNLSKGRAGVSFAPGWNPDDFAFFPERYATRYQHLIEAIGTVRRLWRGETVEALNGEGKTRQVRLYPSPVQSELPVWVTAAAAESSYVRAGELGANLLTHLLDQTEEELARKIGLYREARARAGFDAESGIVSVMLHTFVGEDADAVRAQAKGPYCEYLRNNIGLLNGLARSRGQNIDVAAMNPVDLNDFVEFLYDRFAATRGLIGTPDSCLPLVKRLEAAGVNEVACLLDFGPGVEQIIENLPHLARLRKLAEGGNAERGSARFDLAAVLGRCAIEESGEAFHERLQKHGVEIAGPLRLIETIWRNEGEALGRLQLGTSANNGLDPSHLDACGRVLAAALPVEGDGLYIPYSLGRIRIFEPLQGEVWSHARLLGAGTGLVSVYAVGDGRLLLEIENLTMRSLGGEVELAPLYQTVWEACGEVRATEGDWLIVDAGEALPEQVNEGRVLLLGGGRRRLLEAIVRVHAPAKMWVVTRGAMAVVAGDAPDPEEGGVWALGRSVAVEHAGIWGGLIDIDAATTREQILAAAETGEEMQALRGGERRAPRLEMLSLRAGEPRFATDGTYVITGGTGGLGRRLGAWLRGHGAGQIAVIARREAPLSNGDRLFIADMARENEVQEALEAIRRDLPPIRGVFHLAGALDDGLLQTQTWERFETSGAGKRDGAMALHRGTMSDPLDWFVLFSSLAALAPAPGQGNYAAANAALDALAWRRRAEGRPALSINWGPWSEVGHAVSTYGQLAHAKLAGLGIGALSPSEGLATLGALLVSGETQAAAATIDWERLFAHDARAAALPYFSRMARRTAPSESKAELSERLRELPAGERRPYLQAELTSMVRRALRLKETDVIPARQGLFDLGLDSIVALELKHQLAVSIGRPLRATLLFTHPNIEMLSAYLLEEELQLDAPQCKAATAGSSLDSLSEDALAELIAREIGSRV